MNDPKINFTIVTVYIAVAGSHLVMEHTLYGLLLLQCLPSYWYVLIVGFQVSEQGALLGPKILSPVERSFLSRRSSNQSMEIKAVSMKAQDMVI